MTKFIDQHIGRKLDYDLIVWNLTEGFSPVEAAIRSGRYSVVVAAGGDGTVNRVATALLDTHITMGILPLGSGNGMARSLGFSTTPAKALHELFLFKQTAIDAGAVNGRYFFCTAGLGFDAHIAAAFATRLKRGFISYLRLIFQELPRYKSRHYQVMSEGKILFSEKAFLLTVANAPQYGNDFYIAPAATVCDGKLTVVIVKPFVFVKAPWLLLQFLFKRRKNSASVIRFEAADFTVQRTDGAMLHRDGEPEMQTGALNFSVKPAALRVLVGPAFRVR